MTPGRSRQKKRELEKERVKKIERVRSFWNKKIEANRRKKKRVERPQRAGERKSEELLESSESKGKKKRRGCTNMGTRVWLTKCKRKKKEKKRRKRMDEKKGKEEEITILK